MSKSASQAAAGYKEPDFAAIVVKPKSDMIAHFEDWVMEKTEYDPAKAKTKAEAFAEGIRLGTALRGYHQASPENQERLAEAKAARDEAAAAVEAAPVAPKAAKAAVPAKAAKAAAKPAPVEATPPVKRAPAKKAPAKKAAPATAPADEDEAPF